MSIAPGDEGQSATRGYTQSLAPGPGTFGNLQPIDPLNYGTERVSEVITDSSEVSGESEESPGSRKTTLAG